MEQSALTRGDRHFIGSGISPPPPPQSFFFPSFSNPPPVHIKPLVEWNQSDDYFYCVSQKKEGVYFSCCQEKPTKANDCSVFFFRYYWVSLRILLTITRSTSESNNRNWVFPGCIFFNRVILGLIFFFESGKPRPSTLESCGAKVAATAKVGGESQSFFFVFFCFLILGRSP